jgi:molybdopterin biosynthesis enzyme
MKYGILLPTGDEIRNGTVLDTDSPSIMERILRAFPDAQVCRMPPQPDDAGVISEKIRELVLAQPDLIVLIGGSGGGHRYSSTLGKDFTHSALENRLSPVYSREIYGKNGHLWTKLVCGKWGNTLVVNVPGPYVEACAAAEALVETLCAGKGLNEVNQAMAEAVLRQYPGAEKEGEYQWRCTADFAEG